MGDVLGAPERPILAPTANVNNFLNYRDYNGNSLIKIKSEIENNGDAALNVHAHYFGVRTDLDLPT